MAADKIVAQIDHLGDDETNLSVDRVYADTALERRITRKLDRHILPWVFSLWLLAFIDRSNIGNAKLDGLTTELRLTGSEFNTSLAVFYILYILVDIPSNWLLRIVGGGRYIPLIAVAWGIVGTCVGFVKSYPALIVCRMLLGMCEGGMFGGVILYLSLFYRRHELMFRLGIFYCAAPLSGAFGGLLAAGLARISVPGYDGWPWIFFVEGALTVLVAATAFFFLPDSPSTARFLVEEERVVATRALRRDLYGEEAKTADSERIVLPEEHFNWAEVKPALFSVNTILMSLNFLLILIPIYSFSLFLPTIIHGLGYTSIVETQLFTAPPNFLGFLSVLVFAYSSDRLQMRGPFIVLGLTLGAVGYIMQLASHHTSVQYAGTFLVAMGVFPCSPLVLAWLANNLVPETTRATGLGFQVAFGNCGAFVATFTYLSSDAPRYITGHAINLGAIGLSLLVTAVNMLYIQQENQARTAGKRDHRLAELDPAEFLDEQAQARKLGYNHPRFRYTM